MTTAAGEIIRAYKDIGMRVSYSYGLRDQNRLVYEADERFLKRLPDDLAAVLGPMLAALTIPLDDNFVLFEKLRETYAGDPKVSIQLAPVNLHWCSDEALERVAEVSSRRAVPVHMHLLETPYQRVYARRRMGGSAVEHLERKGLLGPLVTLGHGVWMTEADLDAVAATDTRICTNCSSNMRLKSGTAPLNAMIARDIRVAIGIDEATINDDRAGVSHGDRERRPHDAVRGDDRRHRARAVGRSRHAAPVAATTSLQQVSGKPSHTLPRAPQSGTSGV